MATQQPDDSLVPSEQPELTETRQVSRLFAKLRETADGLVQTVAYNEGYRAGKRRISRSLGEVPSTFQGNLAPEQWNDDTRRCIRNVILLYKVLGDERFESNFGRRETALLRHVARAIRDGQDDAGNADDISVHAATFVGGYDNVVIPPEWDDDDEGALADIKVIRKHTFATLRRQFPGLYQTYFGQKTGSSQAASVAPSTLVRSQAASVAPSTPARSVGSTYPPVKPSSSACPQATSPAEPSPPATLMMAVNTESAVTSGEGVQPPAASPEGV